MVKTLVMVGKTEPRDILEAVQIRPSKRLDVGSRGMETVPDPPLAFVPGVWVNEQRGSRFGRGGVRQGRQT